MKTIIAINTPAFELRGNRIHYTQTGNLICSVWPECQASEERIEGESWLAMRDRTERERDAIKTHTEKRAASLCSFLNSQVMPDGIVKEIIDYIEEVELTLNYGHGKCTSLNELIQTDKMPAIYAILRDRLGSNSTQTATQ